MQRLIEKGLDEAVQFDEDCPTRLAEAIRYSLLAPGKRIRPYFVLLACALCGGDPSNAVPAACAVEMIHTYSLVHDDLPAIDNDDLRRGRSTCHKQFDEPTAILVGDALIPLAFETLGKLSSPALTGICSVELARAAGASALVGGQMDDVANEKNHNSNSDSASIELLERIHLRKTGALIRVSLRLGAIIAGASNRRVAALDDYGKNFGLAFQITDDLIDVQGNTNTAGKQVKKDAELNKWTYPSLLGIEKSEAEAKRYVNEAINALSIFENDYPEKEILTKAAQNLIGRSK
ncbi:MAG: polyprenyl synthetase family protein [Planctomycetaceae bacterium]|nr:polyprenyl synthetase family protein [Planctomycetaceae bacterium]